MKKRKKKRKMKGKASKLAIDTRLDLNKDNKFWYQETSKFITKRIEMG